MVAPSPEPPPEAGATSRPAGRFYQGRDFGSESQFNPVSVLLNEGWDMLRLNDDRSVFARPYRTGFRAMWYTLNNPATVVKHYGVRRWLRYEVFPLSFKSDSGLSGGGQWEPNYHLHLFGAGMTYIRTAEWYEQNGVGHPRLAAAATLYAAHLMNEVIENGAFCCENEDSMTDLLIFDPAGMLLWNTEWMQRTFSGRVEMTNWNGQPVLRLPDNHLENAFSMFMLRTPLPATENWKFISTGGSAFLFGLSRRVGPLWVSGTAGVVPAANPVIDSLTNTKTVGLKPNAGLFIDRDGSLLVSLVGGAGQWNGATLNVYPGVIGSGPLSPGFFVQHATGGPDRGGFRFGIASKLGVGLGGFRR